MRCVTYSRKYDGDEIEEWMLAVVVQDVRNRDGKVNVKGNKNAAVIENDVARFGSEM